MRNKLIPSVALLVLACGCACFGAENPLAALPSKPGPHIGKIQALGDDAWLALGAPERDPAWGMGRGRAYSSKMAYAPDLNGAFFCATGVHGYVKPDGHYMDDLWFYDAAAHRWICLYPGASKETKLKLDEHGFEVTPDGKQQPVSYLSHAYNMVTYNPKRRVYMVLHRPCPWWSKALPQRYEWLGVPEDQRKSGYQMGKLNVDARHPIFWDVDKNEFARPYVEDPAGPKRTDCSVLEYIPERDQAFLLNGGATYFYDFAANKWTDTGARVKIPYDYVGCYDAKRGRVYVLKNADLYAYDMKENAWTPKAKAPAAFGFSTRGQLDFDAAAGLVIGFNFHGTKENPGERGVYVYDPDADAWTKSPAALPAWRGVACSFYHAALNVHYVHAAGDSSDDGKFYVYRHKRAAPPGQEPPQAGSAGTAE